MDNDLKINSRIKILLIMFLGLSVRVFNLNGQGLCLPEVKVVCFAQMALSTLFDFTDAYRPLYILIARPWIRVFGTNEIAVRMLPVLIGVFSLFLIYNVGRRLWDERTGLISAFILSLSVFHVYFSRHGKGVYALLVFLSLSSFILMLKIIENNKWSTHILNVLLHMFILLAHPFGIFWVATQNTCYFILNGSRDKKRWIISLFILTMLLIPWYFYVISFNPERDAGNFSLPNLTVFPQLLEVFSCGGMHLASAGESYAMSPDNMVGSWLLMLIYISIFFLELLPSNRKAACPVKTFGCGDLRKRMTLLVWLMLPLILIFIYSRIIRPIYWPRYVIYAAPAYYLLIGNFISRLEVKKRAIILLLIGLFSLFALKNVYYPERKGDIRDGVRFLEENLKDGDTIIISPAEMIGIIWYYWQDHDRRLLENIDDERGLKVDGRWENDFIFKKHRIINLQFSQISRFDDDFDFEEFKLGEKRIWFFYSPDWMLNGNSRFLDVFLRQRYNLVTGKFFAYDNFWVKCFKTAGDGREGR